MNSLDSLKSLNLIEINLEGNPLKDRIKDQTVYVRYLLGFVCIPITIVSLLSMFCVLVAYVVNPRRLRPPTGAGTGILCSDYDMG